MVEDARGDLGDHRVLLVALGQRVAGRRPQPVELVRVDEADRHLVGEHDDAHHHRDRDQAEQQQGGRRVAALGLAEGGHAVADGLDAGEGRTTRRERAGQQEHQPDLGERLLPPGLGDDHEVGALRLGQVAGQQTHQAVGAHAEDGEHEQVGRHGEERPGLPHAAQVHRGQEDHRDDRDRRLVADQPVDGAGGVLGCRRDRHRDREDVVDEQRARDRHPGVAAEVDRGDLVVAAAGGVGVHGLAVARDDGEHHQRDREADLPRPDVRRRAGDGEHDEDLVGRVRHRGQRVAGEHRQGDPLGEERLPQLAAAELATQQDPLGHVADTHGREPRPAATEIPAGIRFWRARRDHGLWPRRFDARP